MRRAVLVLSMSVSAVACSGQYVPEDPGGTGGSGGSSAGGSGGVATPTVLSSCLAYMGLTGGKKIDENTPVACTDCFQGAMTGSCMGPMMAPLESTGPCGNTTDCVDTCQCDGANCASALCSCLAQCISPAPAVCAALWTEAFTCLASACSAACSTTTS